MSKRKNLYTKDSKESNPVDHNPEEGDDQVELEEEIEPEEEESDEDLSQGDMLEKPVSLHF